MTTRVLQRQIMPLDRDFDVFALYVDAEDATLDADKYEIGGSKAAACISLAPRLEPISYLSASRMAASASM